MPSFAYRFDTIAGPDDEVEVYEDDFDYLSDPGKKEFKRRETPYGTFKEVLRIETNFRIPIVGKDTYFGRIYLTTKNESVVKYRDELLAEKYYSQEKDEEGSFWTSNYEVSDINSSKGLNLVEGAGAIVNLKSSNGKFNTKTGGLLILNVKHPFDGKFALNVRVIIRNGSASTILEVPNKSVPFDSLKINAASFGIATGIKSVDFYKNGQVVHSVKP